jgi:type II secretory pathway pseudopilin PulG
MRRREGGLTLIEILLALVVMMLGLVGILALFPTGLKQGKEAVERTQAALMTESLSEAIALAAGSAVLDNPGAANAHYKLTITHDSIDSKKNAVYYEFLLPNFSDGMASAPTPNAGSKWFHHPATSPSSVGAVSMDEPEKESEWSMAGDPWTKAQFEAIKGTDDKTGTDGSEPLDQFCYSFDVRKINTLEYMMNPPPAGKGMTLQQLDPIARMWEIRIHTFRKKGRSSGGAEGEGEPKSLIATVATRITVR